LFIRQPDQTSLTPRTSKSTTDVRDIAMPVQENGESGKPSTLHETSTSLQSPF
jgi:hypothetical protein